MVAYRHRLLHDSSSGVPPAIGSTKSGGLQNGEMNLDTNMVIVLSALLCALLCALGLNSIVRCALRCARTFPHESANEINARFSLGKEELSRLPVVAYKSGLHILATECTICLGDFVEGEDVRIFPKCNHAFHFKCIDRWLLLHSSCPICRQPLIA